MPVGRNPGGSLGKWASELAGGGGSGIAATQAAVEAETNEVTFATPNLIQHNPGVVKVNVSWEQSGAHGLLYSRNMTSVTDGGAAGDTDHLFDIDFSSANIYYAGGSDGDPSAGGSVMLNHTATTLAATGMTTVLVDNEGAGRDKTEVCMLVWGDQ